MSSNDLTTLDEGHTFRNERKFIYKWVIHNFHCKSVIGGKLPAASFTYTPSEDFQIQGRLSLHNQKCYGRVCRLTICGLQTAHPFKCYMKLWTAGMMQTGVTYCEESSYMIEMSLSGNKSRKCLLTKCPSIIMCEIITAEYTDNENPKFLPIKEPSLSQDLLQLLETKNYSDVTIVVAGHEINAHKYMLASRSKVFAAMFDIEMEEARTNKVTITDIDFEVVEEMLRFIYTNEVRNLSEMIYGLLYASDKYDLPKLKSMCVETLREGISIATAAETLIAADLYNIEELSEEMMHYINRNKRSVTRTEGWEILISNYSYLLEKLNVRTQN